MLNLKNGVESSAPFPVPKPVFKVSLARASIAHLAAIGVAGVYFRENPAADLKGNSFLQNNSVRQGRDLLPRVAYPGAA